MSVPPSGQSIPGRGPRTFIRRLGGPRFAGAIMLDALGSGTVMPLGILFFTLHQHMAATTVGLGLTIGGASSFLLAPVGGQIVDAIGAKRALIGTWLLSSLVAAGWLLVHTLAGLAVIEVVGSLCGGIGWNAGTIVLTARSAPEDQSMVMASQYSLRNFGFGAGGLLSTLALGLGGVAFDAAVLINAASFLIGAALAAGVSIPRRPARSDENPDPMTLWAVLRDGRYVSLAALGSLIAFNQVGLQVILPLWVVHRTAAPREIVGLLFTLNTILVVVGQLYFSRRVREVSDAPRAYLGAALAMIGAAVAYLASHYVGAPPAIALLMVGTLLLTVCEMWSQAASFVVSLGLAHPEHRGKYLSVFSMGWGIENTAGPTVGTALIAVGVFAPWAALAGIVAVGAGASAQLTRGVLRR
ncbi:MFS transporter [Conexibacter sp. DBS9H8]|uniref:MFS transporter n=1 Tax=Conexibacter sp. DBS9H8 TaxID=2937801 RepID=UPI00200D2706|nr:MFS transporter [Conexibacter sp. DBS9H8]